MHLPGCASFPYSSQTVNLELWYKLHFLLPSAFSAFRIPLYEESKILLT